MEKHSNEVQHCLFSKIDTKTEDIQIYRKYIENILRDIQYIEKLLIKLPPIMT